MTDPPYGINYEGTAGTIENDNLQNEEFIQFLVKAFEAADRVMKPGAAFYIWYGSSRSDCFFEAAKKSGMTIREILVWVKNMFTLGRQDYQWRHEPCLYGWKDGAPHYFIDLRSLTTVQEGLEPTREELEKFYKSFLEYTTTQYEDKPLKNDLHPTMKPIPLFERLIRNSSREKEIVLDLFGGSGTTMIACEEMNRDCRMMEYDPHYAEVIIQRWEELTGEKAVKL